MKLIEGWQKLVGDIYNTSYVIQIYKISYHHGGKYIELVKNSTTLKLINNCMNKCVACVKPEWYRVYVVN